MDYIDSLFHEIIKATTREKLQYLEDDINISKGLDQIPNRHDLRFLKLALQNRYSYVLFCEILTELENLNGLMNPEEGLIDKFKEEVDANNIILLKDLT